MPSASNRPRPLGLALALLIALLVGACGGTERPLQVIPGLAVPATIAKGQTQVYVFSLAKDQLADLRVDQQGADIIVTLYAPGGEKLATVDNLYGNQGPEILPVIAETAGRYRLKIQTGSSGRYEIRIAALRPANARDRDRVAAERLFSAGEELDGEAAITRERQAAALFHALGERDREADVLYCLGNAYSSLYRYAGALGSYRQALALFRERGREREAGRVLSDLGIAHKSLGQPQEALARYYEALALSRQVKDRKAEAITLTSLGKLYDEALGETGKALDSYDQALRLWHELGDRSQEATTLKNLGGLYLFQGDPETALVYLERARAIREPEGPTRQMASLLSTLAQAYSRSGEDGKAAEMYQSALGIQRETGDAEGEAGTLNDLGCAYLLVKQPQEARESFVRAASVFRKTGNRQGEATALMNLAWTDTELGHPREAIERLGPILPSLAAPGDRNTEAVALLALARARRRLGDLPGARQAVEAGIARIESLRGASAHPEIRTSFLASNQGFYSFYVDLLMELGKPAQALAASEAARARSLLDLLAEARAGLRRGIDPGLLAREAEAARRVNAAEERRWLLAQAGAPPERLASAEQELRSEITGYDRVQSEIRLASPRYAALNPPRPLDAEQIQGQVLDADTLLLEYALGQERSWLWAVTPERVESFPLPPRATIEEAARNAYGLASQKAPSRSQTQHALAALSRLLLQPAAGLLGHKRLLVVGDGALHFIPFAALPVPGTEALPEPTPLMEEHEIVTAPSASSLAESRRTLAGRQEPPGTLAVVADPVFTARSGFPPLPFSRVEARSILALAPASERLGALGLDASRKTVLSGKLGRYRIVHFATHGVLDPEHPELSKLVLSPVDGEGFLRAHEIYRLDLPADLVVLSACSTGLGKEIRGEGLVGLTRGFQYAGARGVLVSLWEVGDRATAELMRLFYREMLQRGQTPAAALRTAQISLREAGWRAPYYWAGFVLQGDWRPADKPFHPTGIYPGESGEPQLQRRAL